MREKFSKVKQKVSSFQKVSDCEAFMEEALDNPELELDPNKARKTGNKPVKVKVVKVK